MIRLNCQNSSGRRPVWIVVLTVVLFCITATAASQAAEKSPLLDAMKAELDRSMKGLTEKGDPPPYFIGYYIAETRRIQFNASYGAVTSESVTHARNLDVDVRVGDYDFDNTRKIRGDRFAQYFDRMTQSASMPLEDDVEALRAILWIENRQAVQESGRKTDQGQGQYRRTHGSRRSIGRLFQRGASGIRRRSRPAGY